MRKNIYKYLKIYEDLGSKAIEVFRYIFTLLALVFVYLKLKGGFSSEMFEVLVLNISNSVQLSSLLFVILFGVVHHWTDALIWKRILNREFSVSIFQALSMNWTSLAYSFYSPGRVLDIPSKVLLLDKLESKFKWKASTLYNLLKPLSTLILGLYSITFLLTDNWTIPLVLFFVIWMMIIFSWPFKFFDKLIEIFPYWSRNEISMLIGLNCMRVLFLTAEHICILLILRFEFPLGDLFLYLLLIHTLVTFIPQIAGTEILVKSYLCFYFLQIDLHSGAELILGSSVLILWIVNVLFPVLIGLIQQKKAVLKFE